MFKCETCGADQPEDCRCVNIGMTPVNGQAPESISLDRLAADVRTYCRAESRAAEEATLLRSLAEEARGRFLDCQRTREEAERRMRDAYNAAVTP